MENIEIRNFETLKQNWNKFAEDYATDYEPLTLKVGIKILENLLPYLSSKPLKIVELACGSGLFAQHYLTSSLKINKATLFDISDVFLKMSSDGLSGVSQSKNVELMLSNNHNLNSIASQSVDLVFAHLLLNVVDDPDYFIQYFHRISKKNALVSCSMISVDSVNSPMIIWDKALQKTLPQLFEKHRTKFSMGRKEESCQKFKQFDFEVILTYQLEYFIPWEFISAEQIFSYTNFKKALEEMSPKEKEIMKIKINKNFEEMKANRVQVGFINDIYILRRI